MARTLFKAAFLMFVAAGAIGCTGNARFVQKDQTGGIVAIPADSMFRSYYRDEAIKMIREQHNPNFTEADITSEHEVIVGQETRNDQYTDRRKLDKDGKPIGETVAKTNVTTTSDQKEFWIEYRVMPKMVNNTAPAARVAVPTNNGVVQTGATQKPDAVNNRPKTSYNNTQPNMQPEGPSLMGPTGGIR